MKKTSESPADLLGNEVVKEIMDAVQDIRSSKVRSGTFTSKEYQLFCRIKFIKTSRIYTVYRIKGECNGKAFDFEVKIRKYILDLPKQILDEVFEQEDIPIPIGTEYMNGLPKFWQN